MTSLWNARLIDRGKVRSNVVSTIEVGRVSSVEAAGSEKPPEALADLLVVRGHPDENLQLLADPENIEFVMKNGEVVE